MTAEKIPPRLEAKATGNELSSAIVVSFDARWLEPISNRRVRLVLRKRVPRSMSPDLMYIYINSPASILLARARIRSIFSISQNEALKRSDEFQLTAEEIKRYFHEATEVGAYALGSVEVAARPPSLEWLRRRLTFNPPQSFFFLAPAAQKLIDEHAEFRCSPDGTKGTN